MQENIISHNHNETLINQRYKDGYINLTAMAQAEGKLIADYLRLESTKAFLDELSRSMGIPIDLLVIIKTTGPNSGRGTWGHPQIAIHCGQWCSAAFAVLVTRWVMTWMRSKKILRRFWRGRSALFPSCVALADWAFIFTHWHKSIC